MAGCELAERRGRHSMRHTWHVQHEAHMARVLTGPSRVASGCGGGGWRAPPDTVWPWPRRTPSALQTQRRFCRRHVRWLMLQLLAHCALSMLPSFSPSFLPHRPPLPSPAFHPPPSTPFSILSMSAHLRSLCSAASPPVRIAQVSFGNLGPSTTNWQGASNAYWVSAMVVTGRVESMGRRDEGARRA